MASRGGLGTVAIAREHRLHKNAVFSYNLIRPEPVGIELEPVTCQTLMNAVANSTQRWKRTAGHDGLMELVMPWFCSSPVDRAVSLLTDVSLVKGEAGNHIVSPSVVPVKRGQPDRFTFNNLPCCA